MPTQDSLHLAVGLCPWGRALCNRSGPRGHVITIRTSCIIPGYTGVASSGIWFSSILLFYPLLCVSTSAKRQFLLHKYSIVRHKNPLKGFIFPVGMAMSGSALKQLVRTYGNCFHFYFAAYQIVKSDGHGTVAF